MTKFVPGDTVVTVAGLVCTVLAVTEPTKIEDESAALLWNNEHVSLPDRFFSYYPTRLLDRG
jgi:hypothetical protein